MCDYSLMHVKSRAAEKNDELVSHDFGGGSVGFKSVLDKEINSMATAVCLLPGTQLQIEDPLECRAWTRGAVNYQTEVLGPTKHDGGVATFSKRDDMGQYHDALEFPDGEYMPVSKLHAGQRARVLQMPAAEVPATEKAAEPAVEPALTVERVTLRGLLALIGHDR
jgi:hypothetical protein